MKVVSRTPPIAYLRDKPNYDDPLGPPLLELVTVDDQKSVQYFDVNRRMALLMIEKLTNFLLRVDAWDRDNKETPDGAEGIDRGAEEA